MKGPRASGIRANIRMNKYLTFRSTLNVAATVFGTSNRLATLVSANSTLAKEISAVVSAHATFFAATVMAVARFQTKLHLNLELKTKQRTVKGEMLLIPMEFLNFVIQMKTGSYPSKKLFIVLKKWANQLKSFKEKLLGSYGWIRIWMAL
uniref:Uncharacterized protein n=1 Tax=Acrobeloides nanus TaxID=290746 RepID=A0A914DQJ6_9BILA